MHTNTDNKTTDIYTHIHTHRETHTHSKTHAGTHSHVNMTCTPLRIHANTYGQTRTHTHRYTYTHTRRHIHTETHTHTHAHAHTHRHTFYLVCVCMDLKSPLLHMLCFVLVCGFVLGFQFLFLCASMMVAVSFCVVCAVMFKMMLYFS